MSRVRILILVFLAAVGFYFFIIQPHEEGIQVGAVAPVFSLKNQAGETSSLADFSGRPVLLNFWASWCPSCVEEMPSLEQLHRDLAPKGLVVLAVSLDEGWGPIQDFLRRFPVTFTILLDAKAETAAKYGTYLLPETYLIGPDGKVLEKFTGPRDWSSSGVRASIEKYLE